MSLRFKLLFCFMIILSVTAILGAYTYQANKTHTTWLRYMRDGSLYESEHASSILVQLYRIHASIEELIAETLRLKVESGSGDDFTKEIDRTRLLITKAVQDVQDKLGKLYEATQISANIAFEARENEIVEEEEAELLEYHQQIENSFELYQGILNECLESLATGNYMAASLLSEEKLEPIFRENLLPVVNEFKEDSLTELVESINFSLAANINLNRTIMVGVGLTLVIILGLNFFVARTISTPLFRLNNAVQRIKQGETVTAFSTGSKDEIGQLTDDFFAMIAFLEREHDAVKSSRAKVYRRSLGLEKIVAHRTQELVSTNSQLVAEIRQHEKTETKLRQSLEEKDILIREIHHRVKNNLQVVISLLRLQANKVDDTDVRSALEKSQHRMASMALIHESMYRAETLAEVDFKDYLESMVRQLINTYTAGDNIKLELHTAPLLLPIDIAIPCGLIINELVTNSIKHAFPAGASGHITIILSNQPEAKAKLVVADDGKGLPPGMQWDQLESLGLQLVKRLVEQIDADLQVFSDKGVHFILTLPVDAG